MSRTAKREELIGGIEISAATHDSSGTLGCIVHADDKPMILTNVHVVRDEAEQGQVEQNLGLIKQRVELLNREPPCSLALFEEIAGKKVLPVFQPKFAGGLNKDSRVVAIVTKIWETGDAALCEIVDDTKFDASIMADPNFKIKGVAEPKLDLIVMKSGKVTGVTYGKIVAVKEDTIIIKHVFDMLPIASEIAAVQPSLTAGQITRGLVDGTLKLHQTPICLAGDSGSIWVSADEKYAYQHAVGLLHMGNKQENYSVATKMQTVVSKLKFHF